MTALGAPRRAAIRSVARERSLERGLYTPSRKREMARIASLDQTLAQCRVHLADLWSVGTPEARSEAKAPKGAKQKMVGATGFEPATP